MRTIKAFPPNYPAIRRAFPAIKGKDVLFAYGDAIYYPSGKKLTPALEAHERVHIQRQGRDCAGWWERYLVDAAFRLDEEIYAHRAEIRVLQAEGAKRSEIDFVVNRLCSPMYGAGISQLRARELLGLSAKP